MFCARCGATNDENAFRCTACSAVLLRPGQVAPQATEADASLPPASPRLAQSIIVTIFCCQIVGIIAIVYSALAMGQNSAGQFKQAHAYAKTANILAWVAFGLGLVITLPYMIVVIYGALQNPPTP